MTFLTETQHGFLDKAGMKGIYCLVGRQWGSCYV